MKSVLVTTDFSTHSQYSLKYVMELLKNTQEEARVLLVNTYLLNQNGDQKDLIQLNDELRYRSRINLEAQRQDALRWVQNPYIIIETASHMGSLSNVIVNLVKKENIDLIVIGKDGGNNIAQISGLLTLHPCHLLITQDKLHGQIVP